MGIVEASAGLAIGQVATNAITAPLSVSNQNRASRRALEQAGAAAARSVGRAQRTARSREAEVGRESRLLAGRLRTLSSARGVAGGDPAGEASNAALAARRIEAIRAGFGARIEDLTIANRAAAERTRQQQGNAGLAIVQGTLGGITQGLQTIEAGVRLDEEFG